MGGPITRGQLFGNQPIGGCIIGNAQQRFGNAHECNALLIGQAEFLQKRIEERSLVAPRARAFDQLHCHGDGAMTRAAGEFQRLQQSLNRLSLRRQSAFTNGLTE